MAKMRVLEFNRLCSLNAFRIKSDVDLIRKLLSCVHRWNLVLEGVEWVSWLL